MKESVSSALRATFFVHSLVAAVLGALYLAAPTRFGEAVGWPAAQPFDHRVIGTVFLAYALASALATRERSWGRVKLLVQLQMTWTALASLLLLWGLLALGLPPLGWAYLALVAGFGVAFLGSYRSHARRSA